MTPTTALLTAGGVIAAVIMAFVAFGTAVRMLDKLQDLAVQKAGWFVLIGVGLWLLWELAPGSHATLLKLWASLHGGAGVVAKGVKKVL